MKFRALGVYLGPTRAGTLFQVRQGEEAITRFHPDEGLWRNTEAPVLSLATVVDEYDREGYWQRSAEIPFFNGRGEGLPVFFQNLLPEGLNREHLAQLRGCSKADYFDLLAASGDDLPGALAVRPASLDDTLLEKLGINSTEPMTQIVVEEPLRRGSSLSGVQAKLCLVESEGKYHYQDKSPNGRSVIAKLPMTTTADMPVLEELSLRLAAAAGVETSKAKLEPLSAIAEDIPFSLAGSDHFLAIERFDRVESGRVHCEEFAQIFGLHPEQKYWGELVTYSNFAALLVQLGRPEDAVELLRRLTVNELLGNRDAHAKNFSVIYENPRSPKLAPAYDIVAYAALGYRSRHALPFVQGRENGLDGLTRQVLKEFCIQTGMLETKGRALVRRTVEAALDLWPKIISEADLPTTQKEALVTRLRNSGLR